MYGTLVTAALTLTSEHVRRSCTDSRVRLVVCLCACVQICLSEFEEGDILRTLPCFHSYHQGCIDEWLNRSKLCPLCKHPISVDS